MKLRDFLNLIGGGEYVRICDGNVNNIVYEADKNAIRMHYADLLDREIFKIGILFKNTFEVLIK